MEVINEISSIESLMAEANDSLFIELNKKILLSYEVSLNEVKNLT